jgi:thiamine-monophosphate kinase
MGEDAGDLGEFGLIRRLVAGLDARLALGPGVVLGPGDDAAVVKTGGSVVLTTDALIEGVHFDLALSAPADVGYKALAAAASDVAAMGGAPRYALVTLGTPAATLAATLDGIYAGLGECAAELGVAVVGGDTVASERILLSITVAGEPGEQGIVLRGGARAGDVLCVTGTLGGSAAGLALLKAAHHDAEAAELLERFPGLAGAHRRPVARVREGLAAASAGATAMIDISDGLAADAGHLCDASGLGVELRAASIPFAEGLPEAARWAGRDAIELALGGGEDYELAIAIPAVQVSALAAALAPTRVTPVGELGGSERVIIDGARRPLAGLGWDHFRE